MQHDTIRLGNGHESTADMSLWLPYPNIRLLTEDLERETGSAKGLETQESKGRLKASRSKSQNVPPHHRHPSTIPFFAALDDIPHMYLGSQTFQCHPADGQLGRLAQCVRVHTLVQRLRLAMPYISPHPAMPWPSPNHGCHGPAPTMAQPSTPSIPAPSPSSLSMYTYQAKVGNLDLVVLRQQDVARRNVHVDEALGSHERQPPRHLHGHG